MKIEDKDLKLSDNFLKINSSLQIEHEKISKKHKDSHNDTIEALLTLKSNLSVFKNKVKGQPLARKRLIVLKELFESFPKLDVKKLDKQLLKAGWPSENFIIYSSFLFTLILIFSLFFFNSFLNTFYLSLTLPLTIFLTLVLLVSVLVITVCISVALGVRVD